MVPNRLPSREDVSNSLELRSTQTVPTGYLDLPTSLRSILTQSWELFKKKKSKKKTKVSSNTAAFIQAECSSPTAGKLYALQFLGFRTTKDHTRGRLD